MDDIRCPMPLRDEDILQVMREAGEPLFPSDITARLNGEFGADSSVHEVAERLTKLKEGTQLPDGRWTLWRRMS